MRYFYFSKTLKPLHLRIVSCFDILAKIARYIPILTREIVVVTTVFVFSFVGLSVCENQLDAERFQHFYKEKSNKGSTTC